MISKSNLFVIFSSLLISTSVKVAIKASDIRCKEPKPLGCPDIICNMLNSRITDFCKEVTCEGLSPNSCGNGSVFERGLTMCGCCGGCAKYRDIGETCEVTPEDPSLDPDCKDPSCPILKNSCKPGLVCKYLGQNSKVCTPDSQNSNVEGCEDKRNLGMTGQLHYIPTCDEDGSYSPKQCKGSHLEEGVCFCVSPVGERNFGRQWRGSKSQDQTCECSRRTYDLRTKNYIAAMHCSPDGNWEPLQCDHDSNLCYCVDEVTGKLTGGVVPESQWQQLPCYSYNLTNWDLTGRYLRICESEWVAGRRLENQAIMHGLHVLSVKDYNCDYDGSFSPRRRNGPIWYCVTKEGRLGPNFQQIEEKPMDCQCYRDSLFYTEEGRNFQKTCDDSTGNYAEISPYIDSKDMYSCVDKDGFFFGDQVEEKYRCCLLGDCRNAPPNIQLECFNPNTGNGYKPCSYWQT